MTGANFFWPVFPMLGWGIGLIFHAWDTYRSEELSEERIHREIEHLVVRESGGHHFGGHYRRIADTILGVE